MNETFVMSPQTIGLFVFLSILSLGWAFWGTNVSTGIVRREEKKTTQADEVYVQLAKNEEAGTAKMAALLSRLVHFTSPKSMLQSDQNDLHEKLLVAGNPFNVSHPAEQKGIQFAFAVVFSVIFALVGAFFGFSPVIAAALGGGLGFALPIVVVKQDTESRAQSVKKFLPEALDLIAVAMKAGLMFSPALKEVVENMPPSPMRDALDEAVKDLDAGATIEHAMKRLDRKFASPELNAFTKAVVLAGETGADIVDILEKQSEFARDSYESEVQQRVGKLESKIFIYIIPFEIPPLFAMFVFVPIYEMQASGAF